MTIVAREILIDRIDVEEGMALWIEFLEILETTLGEDGMARIAVTRRDLLRSIGGLMVSVMAPETPGPLLVADIIRVSPPICLHLGEEIVPIDVLDGLNGGFDLRMAGVTRL
jgi:hypothetical protein